MTEKTLTPRQQQILTLIDSHTRNHGYPPSVREIGEEVGLTSPSTVHSHLQTLQEKGYLRRDPTKPRAIEVCFDPTSGAAVERGAVRRRAAQRAARQRQRLAPGVQGAVRQRRGTCRWARGRACAWTDGRVSA